MKPQLLKVSKDLIHSFNSRRDTQPDVNNRWHYHPEVEMVYFKKGHGTQYVGDRISPFKEGDIILLGSNLPHYTQFDAAYFNEKKEAEVDVCVVHFDYNFWGDQFLGLPENIMVKDVLDQAKRGIKIVSADSQHISEKLQMLIDAQGVHKIILLLEVLQAIGESKKRVLLTSVGFNHNFSESEKDRIDAIYNYALNNFKKRITLQEIASVANISPTSFCKYFKAKSRKTFSNFINEIRVSNACKLLMEGDLPVKEVCYESGFYNFASFHKCFKRNTGKSPKQYYKSFKGS